MMAGFKLFFTLLTLSCLCFHTFAKNEIVDITIPHTAWDGKKTVLCTAIKSEANHFITMFYPLHRMHTVKHISVAVCQHVYSNESYWECPNPNYVCFAGNNVNFWAVAKDGPAWYLPEGLAAATGSNDGYIVVQVHAPVGMKLESTPEFFATGLRLNITDQEPEYYSGLLTLANGGYIPANTTGFTADVTCEWQYDNNPIFGLSVHSHTMATAITGYIHRDGKLIELIRADPVYPEPIIDISHRGLVLKKGDTVIMRCTLTNPTDKNVNFGYEHTDQMCVLYIIYGILPADYDSNREVTCGTNAQTFRLKYKMPEDSTLPDKEEYAKLMAQMNLTQIKN